METKTLLKIFLLISLSFLIVGCSIFPSYYSKSEIKNYVKSVFGKDYKLIETKSYEDDTKDKNKEYQYIFKNDDNQEFSLYSGTAHSYIDASETIFYHPTLSTDYIQRKISDKQMEIEQLLKKYSINYDFINEYDFIKLYLNNYTEISKVSDFIVELDKLISLEYDESKGKINCSFKTGDIAIYIKPDLITVSEDWNKNWDYRISSLELSSTRKTPLKKEEVYKKIEGDLVEKIKNRKTKEYSISSNLINEYKTKYIRFEFDNFKDITFSYNDKINEYYSSLGICLNREIYDYNHDDTFKNLVEYLGGTFSRDGWSAKWTINNNTWTARMVTNKNKDGDYEFEKMIIKLNGKTLDLSNINSIEETNIFRVYYTEKDLEKMLNAEITIDQYPPKVTITSK